MNPNLIRALVASAALAAVGAPALAQPAAPPPPAARDPGDRGPGRMDPAQRAEMRAQRLRDILQLRPNQEPALAELTAALAPPADMREQMRAARAEMAGMTTPQRLDRMREHMVRRQQAFDRKAMAIKKFYAQLSPAQQKAFDAMGPMMGHRMGMGGKMGRHGMMGGHGGHGMDHGDRD